MDKGYKLHRWGDNVAALLKKIEDFQENFILMRGCGDELAGGTRRCFFNFSYDDIATPVLADKAVFLSWEDRITNLPPVLASCSYVNLGVSGVTVSIDKGEVRRRLLLTRGTNGEIVVAADESYNIVEQENDPIFTQWLQSHELYTKREVDDLLTPIESVIPSSASPSNKLADKDYVDNSIATSTAIFVGTFNSLSELQAVQNPTNNDYGFVIEHDAQGNEYYKRYKYNGTQWLFEYQVESTPFTAAQWAAIQSGITSSLVTKLNDLPNAQELNAINNVISVEGTTKTEVSSEEEAVISGAGGNVTVSVNPMGVQVTAPNSRTFTYNGKQVATRDQIPEYVSQLTNDRGYIRMADLQEPLEYLLGQKQDKLTFDNVPTADSDNPVKSSGVKTAIDAKQDTISDLSTIRSGAAAGATALQSFTESDPTVPAWAKQSTKPSYTAEEVGALPDDYTPPVTSVNGQTGAVSLTIPSAVTESTVSGWGFTKNTGTYSKPSGGIPKTDLASAVQTSLGKADTSYQKPSGGIPKTDLASAVRTSLGKADTALQSHQDISGKADVAALAGYTPTANFATINGASITGGGDVIITAGSSSITTIDAVPTKNSTNPVQSGGVYDAIEGGFYY